MARLSLLLRATTKPRCIALQMKLVVYPSQYRPGIPSFHYFKQHTVLFLNPHHAALANTFSLSYLYLKQALSIKATRYINKVLLFAHIGYVFSPAFHENCCINTVISFLVNVVLHSIIHCKTHTACAVTGKCLAGCYRNFPAL